MSEGGMAFEFSRPPVLHARINFTFQVMGCMPMPHDASVLGESFEATGDRKSTRLNSSHVSISYAVFCLKKKKIKYNVHEHQATRRPSFHPNQLFTHQHFPAL